MTFSVCCQYLVPIQCSLFVSEPTGGNWAEIESSWRYSATGSTCAPNQWDQPTCFKMETMSGIRVAHYIYLIIIASILGIFSLTEGRGNQYVTCGSVVKLLNVDFNVRLHSHDVKYGTGSGQQSVTGTQLQDDVNSHWVIRGEAGKHCSRGTPVKCGDKIRLTHMQTNKNLHSHYFSSPLSGNQEISAYGDDKGEGDTGDNWLVVCDGEFWSRDDTVMFKHIDTSSFLSATERTYGRPINGQSEVVGVSSNSYGHTYWQAMEGLFIHPSDFNAKTHHEHTEL